MRMSGASGSFGVTRYQWPRIIAAKTPPVATASTAELEQQRDRPEGRRPMPGRRRRGRRPRPTSARSGEERRPAPADRATT